MSPTVVRWQTPVTEGAVPARFAPVRITVGGQVLVAAAGEPVDLPDGPFEARADLPGCLPLAVRGETLPPELSLNPEDLRRDPLAPSQVPGPRKLTIAVVRLPGAPPGAAFEVIADRAELRIRQHAGLPAAAGLRIASPVTPSRLLMLPPAVMAEPYRLAWYHSPGRTRRPRVEPLDGGGLLIMEYLLAGSNDLAAATARSVDRVRAEADPLAWVAASYTQLLIGYAYALGHDTDRLSDWCLRTEAATGLGVDGVVLAAEAAWQRREPELARRLLARTAGAAQPAVTFGGELAVRLATLLAVRAYGQQRPSRERVRPDAVLDDRLARINTDGMRVLSRTDPGSALLSVPRTGIPSLDLSGARFGARLRWRVRYALTHWRHTTVRANTVRLPTGPAVQGAAVDSGEANRRTVLGRIAAVALPLTVGTLIAVVPDLTRLTGAAGPWSVLGVAGALALLGAGILSAAGAFQHRLRAATARVERIELRARRDRSAAARERDRPEKTGAGMPSTPMAVLAFWRDHREQVRQYEHQRATLTNVLLVITAGLSAFIVQQHFATRTVAVAALIAAIGVYGALGSAKYHERATYHLGQAGELARSLTDLNALDVEERLDERRAEHFSAYPRLYRLRPLWLWTGLHVGIAVYGLVLVVVALVS
ncbi:hypothetical protein ACQP00_22275 [Dactylosporangium sp. CS-047395]|uniref:hypothetical protein n=1 Tax=Dactylosporangium sp. CS-047395 TaxID=3239936 RepID=UPI003D8F0894